MTVKVTAVFAADAVARMSGTVGVAAVTAGPGTVCIYWNVLILLELRHYNTYDFGRSDLAAGQFILQLRAVWYEEDLQPVPFF